MLASAWAKLAAWRAGRRCKRRAGRLRGRPTQRHTTPGAAPMENPADAWTGQHPQRSGEPRGICRASHPRGAGGAAHAAGEAEEKPPRAALGLNCASIPHPGGPAPRGTREDGRIPELLLDAHELVVLAVALRAAGRPRLDLARAEADGQVGDGAVLGLPRAVGGHHAPAVLLAQLHRVDGLGDGADLVDFEEERVAGLVGDRALHARDVGHREVITHHLRRPPDPLREEGPGGPVVLVEGVLDGDEGEVRAEARVEVRELRARQLELWGLLGLGVPGAEVVAVLALLLELRGGNVHADGALLPVARLLDRLHDELHAAARVAGRGEAALVADERRVAAELLLDDALEGVVALGADLHRLLEGRGADGDDEVLLEGQLVAGVRAAVHHVEAGHRQHHWAAVPRELREVPVERHALRLRRGLGGSDGHTENGIRAKIAFQEYFII